MAKRSLIKTPSVREIRASRRGIRCHTHRFASIGRIDPLAAMGLTNQGRYGRKLGMVSPLECVFRRAIHSTVYSPNVAINVAPKYHLAFRWLQQIGQSHHFRKHLVERVFLSRFAVDHREPIQQVVSLVTRVTGQYRRIDHVVHRQESARSSRGTPDRERELGRAEPARNFWTRSVEMVLKRDAAAVQAARQDTVKAAAPDTPRLSVEKDKRLAQPAHSFSLAEFSPNEVQRLTDHVVSTLDRRIIAMRERLGKV